MMLITYVINIYAVKQAIVQQQYGMTFCRLIVPALKTCKYRYLRAIPACCAAILIDHNTGLACPSVCPSHSHVGGPTSSLVLYSCTVYML